MQNPTLQKLLDDGLAVMTTDDPARWCLQSTLTAGADSQRQTYAVYFFAYAEDPTREAHGSGITPEEALAGFAEKYSPPPTKADRIGAPWLAEWEGQS